MKTKPANEAPRAAWPINEGCHRLGIGRVSLYAMAKRGEIRLIKIAGRTLVPESEIARLTSPATAPEAA